jgi:hypothetical protein
MTLAAAGMEQAQTLQGVDPDLSRRRFPLERLELALELGDRSADLGRAAVLDGAAVVGHARHRAVPLRLERFEARLHSEAVAMSQGHVAAVDHPRLAGACDLDISRG